MEHNTIPDISEEEQMIPPDEDLDDEGLPHWAKAQSQATEHLISLPIYMNIHR
jgi:hypothetical protein